MSDATLLLLRLTFLALLWLFVLLVVAVLRAELSPKRAKSGAAKTRAPAKTTLTSSKASGAVVVTLHTTAGSRAVELDGDQITFGRKSDNTVTLTDDYASGHHCRLVRDGKSWRLEDVGSTNGTYVKGNRIAAPVRLKAGGRFTVGSTEIEIS
jgi:pSer/pThr/pTyr-binding forkhead associated (FHA) protein